MEAAAPGSVYWITGLPGVGKSTLARRLTQQFTAIGQAVVRLDGDQLRPIVGARYGFGLTDRRAMGMIYARLCAELSGQGLQVICATESMLAEVRAWNREHIAAYVEIYLRASPDMLAGRAPRGVIAAAKAGRMRNVLGVDLPFEEPASPDLVVEDDGRRSADEIAVEVLSWLADR